MYCSTQKVVLACTIKIVTLTVPSFILFKLNHRSKYRSSSSSINVRSRSLNGPKMSINCGIFLTNISFAMSKCCTVLKQQYHDITSPVLPSQVKYQHQEHILLDPTYIVPHQSHQNHYHTRAPTTWCMWCAPIIDRVRMPTSLYGRCYSWIKGRRMLYH